MMYRFDIDRAEGAVKRLGEVIRNLEEDRDKAERRAESAERQRYFDVRPFMHPDGKIYTIKMVRALQNIGLLDAKNLVDGWVRDGKVEDIRPLSVSPFAMPTPNSAYSAGDSRVGKYGVVYERTNSTASYCVFDRKEIDDICLHWKRAPIEPAQWDSRFPYNKGDRVSRNGATFECTKMVMMHEFCFGPGDLDCGHFKKV